MKRGFRISAFKAPVYVVVTPSGTRAFDTTGAEVDPKSLPGDCHLWLSPPGPRYREGQASQYPSLPYTLRPFNRRAQGARHERGRLVADLDVPTNRITAILNGQRAITGDTALRLAHFFGTSAEFWLNLQKIYELRLAEQKAGKSIAALPTLHEEGLHA